MACDKHGDSESGSKYEAVTKSLQSNRINPPPPSSNVETSRATGCVMQFGAKRAVDARAILLLEKGARLRMLMRLFRGQVSGARKRLHM